MLNNMPIIHFIIVLLGMIFAYLAITYSIENIKILIKKNKMRKFQGNSGVHIVNVDGNVIGRGLYCISNGSETRCIDSDGNVTHYVKSADGKLFKADNNEGKIVFPYINPNDLISTEGGHGSSHKNID
jgi:hypothetical protein